MTLQELVKKEYIENDNTLCFKTTSITKIVILSILTCGFYDYILLLTYWKTLKENFGYNVSPFWRGFVFGGFTNFKLFPLFKKYFENFNTKFANGTVLALLFFICAGIVNKIASETMSLEKTNWTLELASLSFRLVSTIILAYIQSKINKTNETYFPNAIRNKWGVANTIWAIISATLLIISYLPE